MKLNRRSVLGAIGTIGIGTGAAFGSGAFTSTTAERQVEVNVLGADLGTAGDGLAVTNGNATAENTIAEEITTSFADVLVDTSAETVDIRDTDGDIIGQPGNVFPSFEDGDVSTSGGSYSDFNESYVSLVANDVRVVFGQNGLPANSSIGYDPLFGFTTETTVDVFFDGAGIGGNNSILTNVGSQTNFGTDNVVFDSSEGSSATKSGDIATGTDSQRVQALDVVIEPEA